MKKKRHLFGYLCVFVLLFLTAGQGRDYKGAELRTYEEFTYGRFEVRMKAPDAQGVLSSLFTYHEISDLSEWNEVDIEVIGRYENCIQFNTITPNRANHISSHWVNFNPQNDYHDYAFEWTPDYVAWFIDGQEVYRQTGAHIATLSLPQKMMMNIWNPMYENWVGEWDPRVLPVFACYDWAKYSAYTPGTGNTGTSDNFTVQWLDDFDTWDQTRWDKATHTFDGNNCDFLPDNVVFKDGNMILCLTDDEDTGYVDHNPPVPLWATGQGNRIRVKFSEQVSAATAGNAANYKITGIDIYSAQLLQGQRYVELVTDELDKESSYNLAVLGIKDISEAENKLIGQVIKVNLDFVDTFPLRINFGGNEYSGYVAAQNRTPATAHGYMDGADVIWPSGIDIANTTDDTIFYSERKALVNYSVRLDNGVYDLILKFAENKYEITGARIFDVYIEGQKLISSLDIFEQVGKNAAHEISIDDIKIEDQELNIHFAAIVDESLINALEIIRDPSGLRGSFMESADDYWIAQNFPNPFNSQTTFTFNMPVKGNVRLEVFDVRGGRISTILEQELSAGRHFFNYNFDAASGLYFYRFDVRNNFSSYQEIRKMILVR